MVTRLFCLLRSTIECQNLLMEVRRKKSELVDRSAKLVDRCIKTILD
jgi:hypothetical protein